jgi:hypothetical protein
MPSPISDWKEISPDLVTHDMMGHFSRPERTAMAALLGLHGTPIGTDPELQQLLGTSARSISRAQGVRNSALGKLKDLLKSMADCRDATAGQIRLAKAIPPFVAIDPRHLTHELLEHCLGKETKELEVVLRIYFGTPERPSVNPSELREEMGERVTTLLPAALGKLLGHFRGDPPREASGQINPSQSPSSPINIRSPRPTKSPKAKPPFAGRSRRSAGATDGNSAGTGEET